MIRLETFTIEEYDEKGSTTYTVKQDEKEVGELRLITTDGHRVKIDLIVIEDEFKRQGNGTAVIDIVRSMYPGAHFYGEVLTRESYSFWKSIMPDLIPYYGRMPFEFQ